MDDSVDGDLSVVQVEGLAQVMGEGFNEDIEEEAARKTHTTH